MAGRPSKPLVLVQGHKTKAEKNARANGESVVSSSLKIREPAAVRANPEAHKNFLRLRLLFRDIGMDDAFFENVISRYCLLTAEQAQIEINRSRTERALDKLDDQCDEMEVPDYIKAVVELNKALVSYDRILSKKRDQLLAIERENLLTVQGKLRSVPKKEERKELDGMAAFLQRRADAT